MCFLDRIAPPLLLLAVLLAGLHATPARAEGETPVITGPGECESCHTQLQEEWLLDSVANLAYDQHFRKGMGCVDCHGGDYTATDKSAAHDPAHGYIGIPSELDIPALCGSCHNDPEFMAAQNPQLPVDQYMRYWTSRHGQLLRMGMRKVAQCSSCHTAHNVRPANDTRSSVYPANVPQTCANCHSDTDYMAGYRIPTDQFEKYRYSVHGVALLDEGDIAAPACNDCHGNHGAVPPGVQSISHVCGMCHSLVADYFEESPHAAHFAAEGIGQCTACHDYHAVAHPQPAMFNMGPDSVCISCHRHDDAGWQTGRQLFTMVSNLTELREEASRELANAKNLGMDITEGEFLLQDFRNNFLELRTLSHSFDMELIETKAEEAVTQASEARAVAFGAVEEFHFRRRGLLVALLLSVPVIIILAVKIRSLDI